MEDNYLVAFFDILGYKHIADTDDIERVSKIISGTIKIMPERVNEMVRSLYSGEIRPNIETNVLGQIKTRLISDSILISAPIPSLYKRIELWWNFLLYAKCLCREMFDTGLPIRGAIDVGTFYVDEFCFAGKASMNCYRLAESLNFSGVVLTDRARTEFTTLVKETPILAKDGQLPLGIDYLAPLRDGTEKRLFILNWWHGKICSADIRQAVFESFSGYAKDVSLKEQPKIQNTEMTLRAFTQRNKKEQM